jgi:hypothetical protein
MGILLPSFELVTPLPPYPPASEALANQWDHPIWAAPHEGMADYVVSENIKDVPPADSHGRRSRPLPYSLV